MKLYICSTYYHVLITLVKAILNNERYDLCLYNGIPEYLVLKEKLEKTMLFHSIYIYNQQMINKRTQYKSRVEKLLKAKRYFVSTVEEYLSIDLKSYDDIYIFNDASSLGKYMILKHIQFHLIEDALDFFKYFDRYYELNRGDYTPGTIIYFLRGLITAQFWGSSPHVIDIEVNDINGIKIPLSKVIEVPRLQLFQSLSDEERVFIYNTFAANKHVSFSNKKSVILCTQPLWTDKFVSSPKEQERVFEQAITDYVNKGYYVVIKPHPRDEIDYSNLIEKYSCGYIDKNLPSEVLNFNPNIKYDQAISITSTSINFLNYADKKTFLGMDYVKKVLDDE